MSVRLAISEWNRSSEAKYYRKSAGFMSAPSTDLVQLSNRTQKFRQKFGRVPTCRLGASMQARAQAWHSSALRYPAHARGGHPVALQRLPDHRAILFQSRQGFADRRLADTGLPGQIASCSIRKPGCGGGVEAASVTKAPSRQPRGSPSRVFDMAPHRFLTLSAQHLVYRRRSI